VSQPRFETYDDDAGEPRFRLVGGNGEKMMASEAYATSANAERGIKDVQVAVLRTLRAELGNVFEALARLQEDEPERFAELSKRFGDSTEAVASYIIDLVAEEI
jgi:uncharacterized protein YegP (UPF0339 family)